VSFSRTSSVAGERGFGTGWGMDWFMTWRSLVKFEERIMNICLEEEK
jgi:hypothetical protein